LQLRDAGIARVQKYNFRGKGDRSKETVLPWDRRFYRPDCSAEHSLWISQKCSASC